MRILITKDSKGKIRVIEIETTENYEIKRTTYAYGCKKTTQPTLTITEGKASRTIQEQFNLELNSIIKKYKDKGYKEFPDTLDINNEEQVKEFVGEDAKTDANGFKKHMLALQASKVPPKVFTIVKYWYGSRKLDGLRLSLYWNGSNVETASRGGQKYVGLDHITKHPKLIEFFQKHPSYVLDGELYKHGMSLQTISGLVRREEQSPELEYYIYDLMDGDLAFKDRLVVLNQIKEELALDFQPEKVWNENDLQLQMVPHEIVSGWDSIQALHDKYVSEGFEGLVIRDPDKKYLFGARNRALVKIKNYRDDCFKVVGKEPGLRGAEDMVFIMELPDGRTFKAKPFGNLAQKQEYWNNFDVSYKGHIGECKFFYYSNDGIPLQPNFKAFRFDIES